VDLSLQSTLVEVLLCIEAGMGPTAGHRPMNICCRWCLVVVKVVVVACTGDDVMGMVFAGAEPVAVEALALAGEGCLWLAASLLALLFLARFVATCSELASSLPFAWPCVPA
jgi:hypothetical protein